MKFTNPIMVELMVPRGQETARRIHGFYGEIGWDVRNDSRSDLDTLASPNIDSYPTPTIAYWQTTDPYHMDDFNECSAQLPSEYAVGLRLPKLLSKVEVVLLVPTDNDVLAIFEEGGKLLESHAHVPPREHAGRQEFRFSDPFNYALRVTADPGYEVNLRQ